MAGERARQFAGNMIHYHMAKVDYTHDGTAKAFGDVPACQIVEVYVSKTADFNAGTSAVIDIGVSGDPDGLVDGANLGSATALGPLEVAQVDSAAWTVTEPSALTVTVTQSGARSAGEAYVAVAYIPLSEVKDLT